MTIARALLPFALLATLTASTPKISEEDYASMPEAFATYTRANVAWRAVEDRMNFEEGFHISEAEVDAVFRFLAMEPNFDAATEKDLGMAENPQFKWAHKPKIIIAMVMYFQNNQGVIDGDRDPLAQRILQPEAFELVLDTILSVQAECDAKAWPAALAEELEDFCVSLVDNMGRIVENVLAFSKPKRDGLTGLEVLLRLRRDDVIKVYERSLLIQEDREAAAGSLGLIRGALSLPLDPAPGDLEAIAEELGPAGEKLLKEILEEDAAAAAPPTDGLAARAFKWASSFFAGDSDGEADL
jgi:hypothetical protein